MEGKRVGVIGGGQLAWMMEEAASSLGIELFVQTPNQDDPAVSRATKVIFAPIDNAEATAQLATLCDVVTFENEFINLKALKSLAQQGICFRPSLDALTPLLDKYSQRNYLQQIGLPVPRFTSLSADSETSFPDQFPVVLKAPRHGYDGQGTFIIKNQPELEATWERLQHPDMLLEEFIPFDKELATIAARSESGEIVIYPVVETYQHNQVCRWVIAPADVSTQVQAQAQAIAQTLLTKLQVVGVFGIEFFLTKEGKLLVNEIAPRTHNSGHYTLDGCQTSQFEMQLRAVAGLPLGSPALKTAGAVMVNLLGYEHDQSDYQSQRDQLSALPQAYVHWYGKIQSRPGRKLGHVTLLLSEAQLPQARQIAEQVEAIWYPS